MSAMEMNMVFVLRMRMKKKAMFLQKNFVKCLKKIQIIKAVTKINNV